MCDGAVVIDSQNLSTTPMLAACTMQEVENPTMKLEALPGKLSPFLVPFLSLGPVP